MALPNKTIGEFTEATTSISTDKYLIEQNGVTKYIKSSTFLAAVSGYQPLDATLTSLAAYNTNGLLTQTAADTFTGRTLTGTASQITVTNGNGVSGNPTISLPTDVVITTSLTVPTLYGSASSGGTLTLYSTSHVTKGKLLFGLSSYDEATNRLGINTTSPSVPADIRANQSASGHVLDLHNIGDGVATTNETALRFYSSVGSNPDYLIGRIYTEMDGTSLGDGRLTISTEGAEAVSFKYGLTGFGINTPTSKVHVKGDGATSATFALKLENSASTVLAHIRNDGQIMFGTSTPFSNCVFSVNGDISMDATAYLRFDGLARFGCTPGDSAFYTSVWASGNNEGINFLNYNGVSTIATMRDTNSGSAMGVGFNHVPPASTTFSVQGVGATSATYTAKFNNSSGTSNTLIIRDDGNIGIGTSTLPSLLSIKAGTTAVAQINLAAGVAPTSPTDGDIFYIDTNDRLMFRKNATSCEILSVSAATTETVTADTTLTVTFNGATYKLDARLVP